MPTWRCPHCGTPQAEAGRCWVCRRSSTSCATCRHFRRSVAASLGYCGLDPKRQPLRGDEMRGCWEEAPALAAPGPVGPTVRVGPLTDERPRLAFVPVGRDAELPRPRRARATPPGPTTDAAPPAAFGDPGGLWAEADA